MRAESEIRKLLQRLDEQNSTICTELTSVGLPVERFEQLASLFNSNSQLLCALKWVLGEDTIRLGAVRAEMTA